MAAKNKTAKKPTKKRRAVAASDDATVEVAARAAATEAGFDRVEKALEEAAYEALAEAHERSEAHWQKARDEEEHRERERRTLGHKAPRPPNATAASASERFLDYLERLGALPPNVAALPRDTSLTRVVLALEAEGIPRSSLERILRQLQLVPSTLAPTHGSYFEVLGVPPGDAAPDLDAARLAARESALEIADPPARAARLALIDEAYGVLSRPDLAQAMRRALADPRTPNLHS
ncbi:MAG: hypothetical protein HYV07_24950 [Deltaproteobacteria bacterium]|nr:hypothetical protein [Deltaproteobacteria bacterium]